MPILLDSDTIAICSRMDGDCSQFFFSSKSPHRPLSPPAFPSQLNVVSASITHPDTPPQPPGVQLWEIPQLPLLSAVPPTSTHQSDDSPTLTPSPASAEADDSEPATHLPPSATLSPHPSPSQLSPPRDDIQTINHTRPSMVSSASSPTVPLQSDQIEYFKNVVGPEETKRIGYLVQATQGFIASKNIDRRVFTTVLGLWSGGFDGSGSGPIKRLERLARRYAKIKHYFADLLYIIYFAHEVDLVAQSERPKVGKGKGRRRQSEALSKIAASLGIDEKAVTAMKRKSRNYRLLLRQGSPGSLLQIGPGVDTLWHYRLKEDDIPILLQYRKEYLPDLEKQAHELDLFASEILIACMVPFGWSYGELAATQSELTKSIQPHKDLQGLAQGIICLTIEIPSLGMSRGPGASKDGIQGKRRCSDSDNADRQVKQVRLPQSFEELDMSMMTELTRIPGELDMSLLTGLLPMPGELDMSLLTGLLPMPGEPDVSMLTGLLPMPGELDMSMLVELPKAQPAQTAGVDMYGNWAGETHG